jgi:hypothetical protein
VTTEPNGIAGRTRKHYAVNARLEIANRPDVIRKVEEAGFLALPIATQADHKVREWMR